jgi:hypothetical protein
VPEGAGKNFAVGDFSPDEAGAIEAFGFDGGGFPGLVGVAALDDAAVEGWGLGEAKDLLWGQGHGEGLGTACR